MRGRFEVTATREDADVVIAEFEDEEHLAQPVSVQEAPVVLLLPADGMSSVADALRSGARAVLRSDATDAQVVAAVTAAHAGLVVFEASDAEEVAINNRRARGSETLTAREQEVLGLMAEGLGNKEIAWRLKISEHTVKFHVGSVMAKLGATSRTEAVTAGIRGGWVLV